MDFSLRFKKLPERAPKHTTEARIIFRVGYSFSELGKFPPGIFFFLSLGLESSISRNRRKTFF